jgi:hypothetical protein
MKPSTSSLFAIGLAAVTTALFSLSKSAAQQTSMNASPFGLEIGTASCDAARSKLGNITESKLDASDVLLAADNPSELYEGATKAIVRCRGDRVIAVQFEASQGGVSNATSREVYSVLSRQYKLAAGGPMPRVGDGYARFVSGHSVIEQSAPHLSFEFTVTYYEKGFYEGIVASDKAQAEQGKKFMTSAL